MKNSRIITYVILAVVVILLIAVHGNIVDLKGDVELKYAEIQVNLQRRVDLFPNYLETVKAQVEHEEVIVSMITEARAIGSQAVSTTENGDVAKTEEAIANYDIAVDNYMNFIAENYPELSAGQAFQDLRDELAGTENRIGTSRRYYNEAVDKYNRYIDKFPGILIASIMGAKHAELFSAVEGSDVAPTYSFD